MIEIRVFALPKVIKERSIGGEDTQLHSDKDGGRSVRERILAKKTEEHKFRKETKFREERDKQSR